MPPCSGKFYTGVFQILPVHLSNAGVVDRFFGCSSHPLCKATRQTRKNGAVVELIAEEKYQTVDAALGSPEDSALAVLDKADPTGTTRSVL